MGLAPSCLSSLITRKPVSRYNSRNSSDITLLIVILVVFLSLRQTLGDGAFLFAAPNLWNDLPREIREFTSADNFKTKLKTFLFERAFRFI